MEKKKKKRENKLKIENKLDGLRVHVTTSTFDGVDKVVGLSDGILLIFFFFFFFFFFNLIY